MPSCRQIRSECLPRQLLAISDGYSTLCVLALGHTEQSHKGALNSYLEAQSSALTFARVEWMWLMQATA